MQYSIHTSDDDFLVIAPQNIPQRMQSSAIMSKEAVTDASLYQWQHMAGMAGSAYSKTCSGHD